MSELFPANGTGVSTRTEIEVQPEDVAAVFETQPELATALGFTPSIAPENGPGTTPTLPVSDESFDHVPEPGVFNAPKFGS